jgi:hypothetical protein
VTVVDVRRVRVLKARLTLPGAWEADCVTVTVTVVPEAPCVTVTVVVLVGLADGVTVVVELASGAR